MQIEPPIRPPKLPPDGWVQYRVYFFNGGDHIQKVHEFVAKDDGAAMKIAEGWREGRKIELWQRERLVKRWD
jgi:hypothetical protein